MTSHLRLFLRREWPILLLPLLPIGIFSEALFGGGVFWQRDIGLFWYPQAEAFVRVVAGGALPLWNPYFAFGSPLLADPGNQILYPLTWLNLVLLPHTFYKVYTLFHTTVAGVGLYLLVRRWGLDRLPSFVAGAAWMASGPLLVLVSHNHHFAGTSWLPWVLLALDRTLTSGSLRDAVVLGSVAATQVLAGSGDLCLMSAFASAGYVTVFLANAKGPVLARARMLAAPCLVAVPFAALLSAAQWLPTLAILSSGKRLQLDPSIRTYWSLHPVSLLDLWVPRLVNDIPANAEWRAALFQAREPLFACIYVGAAAAAMVGASLVLGWNRLKAYAAGGFVFSILAALGGHTPFYPWLTRVTPLFLFRYPEKYVALAGVFWAMLVALAFQDWIRDDVPGSGRRWRLATAVAAGVASSLLLASAWVPSGPAILRHLVEPIGAVDRELFLAEAAQKCVRAGVAASGVALLVWLRGRRPARARWTMGVLAALVLGDLASVGLRINPLSPPELMRARPPLLSRLGVGEGSRIWVSMSKSREWLNHQVIRGPVAWKWQWWWAAGLRDMIWPPTGARWGLLGSYDEDLTGLSPPLVANLTTVLRGAMGSPLGKRILQVGGVDYVVGLDPWPVLEKRAQIDSTFAQPIQVYKVPETRPRTYVVHRARAVAEPGSVERLCEDSFDPESEIIVPPGAPELPGSAADPSDSLRLLWRRGDSIGLAVDTRDEAYVVALESFDAGWRARVDGDPEDIVRANVLFQAVHVRAGHHTVVFEYRPTSVAWGAGLSAGAAALGIGFLWRSRPTKPSGLPTRAVAQ